MITYAQAQTATRFEHVTLKNADGTPLRVRRTGKTKQWKREPERFEFPVKHGLYQSAYITNANAHEWNVAP